MTSLALFPLLLASASPQDFASAAPPEPRVRVWLDSDDGYDRGERARIHVRAGEDGYLVVLHADPQGVVRVLFPLDPYIDDFVRAGELVEVRGRGDRDAFMIDDRTGSGLVLAAWSQEPFRFDGLARGDHWDYRMIAAEGVAADPEAGLLDIVHVMAAGRGFDYDAAPYLVGGARRGGGAVSHSIGYDPWNGPRVHTSYARSGFHLTLNLGVFAGDPWLHGAIYYDPFFPFGRPIWYRPVYYDPYYWGRSHRRVWVHDPFFWVHIPRYRHRGIGVHLRYAGGWCRYDAFCGPRYARGRPGFATGVGLASDAGWGGIRGDVGRAFGSRDGWGSGTVGSVGRTAVGIGSGSSGGRVGGGTGIGARVGTGTAAGSAVGRSSGTRTAEPRSASGSGLRGVIIGSRSAAPRESNATGVGGGSSSERGRIGQRATGDAGGGTAERSAPPRREGTISGRSGTISGRSGTISGRSGGTGRGEGTITVRTASPRGSSSSPPPSTRSSTTRRIGDAIGSAPSSRPTSPPSTRSSAPTTRRSSPPSPSRSGTGRIGNVNRSSPTTRAATPRSGSGSISRSAPTTRRSSPPRATSSRPAPSMRASPPSRSGSGRASGSASSRGSSSGRTGGRIGGAR